MQELTAESIEDAVYRANALADIAAAQAQAGLLDDALKTFARAQKTVESEEGASSRAWELILLSGVQSLPCKPAMQAELPQIDRPS